MTCVLMRRLSRLGVDTILADIQLDLANVGRDPDDRYTYAPSGGTRVHAKQLDLVETDIVRIAIEFGFPNELTIAGRQQFDTKCSIYLANWTEVAGAELFRDDVWAYLATALLPHVTLWRFPTLTPDRFHGGERNMFQRLWYRAITLDRGVGHSARWELLEALNEDAIAQIVERPSIRNDRRLAIAIAEGYLKSATRMPGLGMERVMRRATRLLRMRNEIQMLSALADAELFRIVDEHFAEAVLSEAKDVEATALDEAMNTAPALGWADRLRAQLRGT